MGLPIKKADHKFAYAEYRGWPEDERWELIDGVAYNMCPAPSVDHQRISRKLSTIIDRFLAGTGCELFAAPFDVFFPDHDQQPLSEINTVVQPDISIVCDAGRLTAQGCVGSPDVVIEILSPRTSQKDLSEKFYLYEKHGVKEYWIVDLGNRYVRVFHLQNDGEYDFGTLIEKEGAAVSAALEGLTVDVKELFADDRLATSGSLDL